MKLLLIFSLILLSMNPTTSQAQVVEEDVLMQEMLLEDAQLVLENESSYIKKSKLMVCRQIGFGGILDFLSLACTNFKKERFRISLIGLGASLGVQGGFAFIHPKKGTRPLKEGTYRNVSFSGLTLGIGYTKLHLKNDNESINYRIHGLTIGAAINVTNGIVTIRKLP